MTILNRTFLLFGLLPALIFVTSCNNEDDIPPVENEEEVITTLELTFSPEDGGTPLVYSYYDADGEGPEDATADEIRLSANTTYVLGLRVLNETEEPAENITEEISEESNAHLFLFGWTDGIFQTPANGDIDSNRTDVIYNDTDVNDLPVGLSTTWTTAEAGTGTFRVVLKHQPDIKSETSGIDDGESDIDTDQAFTIVVE